jgi:hypothetical protein
MNKLSKKELLQEINTCLERNDVSQTDFVILHALYYLLGEPDIHIGMLISCAYLRNVACLQHRTIHEFSQFVEEVMNNKEKFKKYQFDWNDHNAIETWIEKFHEYCKEEYKKSFS